QREPVSKCDHRTMTLIGNAQAALLLAEPRDNTLVRPYAIAVRLEGISGLRQGVADLGKHAPVAAVSEIHLQAVVVSDAQVHDYTHLTHATIRRQDGPRSVGCGHGLGRRTGRVDAYRAAKLSGCCPIKRRRRVQINRAIEIAYMLMHIVATEEQSPGYLALGAKGKHLTAGIH